MKKIILLFSIFHLSTIFGQDLSTYFLDSLKVIVNHDTLAYTGKTKIFYFKNKRDTQIVVFQNQTYKLAIDFKFYDIGTYMVQQGWPIFFKNDITVPLAQIGDTADIKSCDMSSGKEALLTSTLITKSLDKIFAKVNYRTTYLAPKDTSNYKYTYRQGPWIGRFKIDKNSLDATLYVNYENDLKDGDAKLVWEDEGEFATPFQNGFRVNEGHFNLDKAKRPKYRKRPIPSIIFFECSE